MSEHAPDRLWAGIDIPKNASKGTYVVKNRVEAGDSYDERIATFTIR